MKSFRIAAALALLASAAQPALAVPAPRVGVASINELSQPLPKPYDEAANADAAVAAALKRAKAMRKRLLIDLGGNWCADCRILAGVMDEPALKRFIDKHFVVVTVDVGRFDKNLQIPARYGITKRLEGVPAILAVDPRTNKLLNAGRVSALSDARSMSPQALADWLAQWAA
jgi:thiol-disulfide isomerase/thioredoxin